MVVGDLRQKKETDNNLSTSIEHHLKKKTLVT